MALVVTWAIGAAPPFTRSYNVTNAKARAILTRRAVHLGLFVEGMSDEQIVFALIDHDMQEHVRGAKDAQRAELVAANQVAIEQAVEADNTL